MFLQNAQVEPAPQTQAKAEETPTSVHETKKVNAQQVFIGGNYIVDPTTYLKPPKVAKVLGGCRNT
jgi:hypothetical protein